jgi:uncharacterized zinc-type alcohol dehydrogenase-like protein
VHEKLRAARHAPEEQLAAVAPLLCAGITTYSPLRHWKAGPGKKVGVVGIGGLGHMGIKLAARHGRARGAFTTSPESKRRGCQALGAMKWSCRATRSRWPRTEQLRPDRQHRGGAARPRPLPAAAQARRHHGAGRRAGHAAPVAAGVQPDHEAPRARRLDDRRHPETQEMLDFCAEHGIVADIEMIRADEINEAYERMLKGDVKYRFVIDSATLAA